MMEMKAALSKTAITNMHSASHTLTLAQPARAPHMNASSLGCQG